ncbi:carbohydrate ABC transporter permease [Roseibium porphyridii]|uniref:Carbohydrate ABC transporter permease n=1 Tax=Roseibium porphyridii TaxID=2866279 RepID=A0ABY8F6Y6_9HYPH|nr:MULTISPECIES: carbohydrate ABC transporter permease [Stappiaceae]QFT30485.1 L-arabinose transport system permease protein AraQ [Labrenzia sp. THAF82]WFE91126.1 carbohydrate ABC transporter permease [Roseibium sp. KMA01]
MPDIDTLPDFNRKKPFNPRRFATRVAVYSILIVVGLFTIMPLAVILLNSLRFNADILRESFIGWPTRITLENWDVAWSSACINASCTGVKPYFIASMLMVVPATLISTAIGLVNGFALTKWKMPFASVVFVAITIGVFLPPQVVLLPWAIALSWLGLSKSLAGLALVHIIQGTCFTTLFCRNYLVNLPDDLIKAARIDGAGFFRTFWKIVVPLSPPIIIVTIIWQFTFIWNEFLFAVTFSSSDFRPITAALMSLNADDTGVSEYGFGSAAVLIAAIPPLLIYFFGGRYFVRGLTQGAVK